MRGAQRVGDTLAGDRHRERRIDEDLIDRPIAREGDCGVAVAPESAVATARHSACDGVDGALGGRSREARHRLAGRGMRASRRRGCDRSRGGRSRDGRREGSRREGRSGRRRDGHHGGRDDRQRRAARPRPRRRAQSVRVSPVSRTACAPAKARRGRRRCPRTQARRRLRPSGACVQRSDAERASPPVRPAQGWDPQAQERRRGAMAPGGRLKGPARARPRPHRKPRRTAAGATPQAAVSAAGER